MALRRARDAACLLLLAIQLTAAAAKESSIIKSAGTATLANGNGDIDPSGRSWMAYGGKH
jgi:hypothetical protein